MNKKSGIYCIENPIGCVYVGASINIKRRWSSHKSSFMKSGIPRLKNSFETYGVKNHKFYVLEYCDESYFKERERYWQEKLNVLSDLGLNSYIIGFDNLKYVFIKETLTKFSESKKNKKHTDEWRENLSKALKGRVFSDKHRENISKSKLGKPNANKGIPLSEEHKDKLRNLNLGKKWSKERHESNKKRLKNKISPLLNKKITEEHKIKMRGKRSNASGCRHRLSIKIMNVETEFIYDNIRIASEILKINYATLKS